MRLLPSTMPKVRDQTVSHLLNPESTIRRDGWPDDPDNHIENIGRCLAVSDLYWVTPEMAGLSVASAGTLDELRWTVADRPSTFGLVIWEGGVGSVRWVSGDNRAAMPATAVSWAPHPDGLLVALWVSRQVMLDQVVARGGSLAMATTAVPPLIPACADILPVSDRFTSVADLSDVAPRQLMPVIYATWTLMQQRGIADTRRAEIDRKIRSSYAHRGRPEPEVSIVTLRRRYIPSQHDPAPEGEPAGRHYNHRWVVRGFWRDQACGPGWSERRKTWVASYIKGPDDAPLLERERVNVWRR